MNEWTVDSSDILQRNGKLLSVNPSMYFLSSCDFKYSLSESTESMPGTKVLTLARL